MSPRRKKVLTLSEVSRRTGISMPTLQKYKKLYGAKLASVGEGRKQRYLLESLPVFEQLRREGLARRGGGGHKKKRKAGKSKAKSARRSSSTPPGLLSLQRIKEVTGISYPTLLRYVSLHLDKIPHVGEGRKRRYPKEAIDVFVELRKNSPRGRKPKAGSPSANAQAASAAARLEKKIVELQRSQTQLERQVRELAEYMRRPVVLTMKR